MSDILFVAHTGLGDLVMVSQEVSVCMYVYVCVPFVDYTVESSSLKGHL